LKEVLPKLKDFRPWPIIAWIVGGLGQWGKTKGDIDILWKFPPDMPEYFKHVLEFRVGRMFKDPEIAERLHHSYDTFHGPFTPAIPIYTLELKRINPEGKVMEELLEKVLREKPRIEEVLPEAEASAKEDKVKMFRFFLPLKPVRGYFPEKRQTIEMFLSLFKLEDFPVYSSKKYDGAHHIIYRDGSKVKIISEDGEENTERLPKTVEEILALPVKNFIALAEIELWEGKKHLPREAITGYLHAKEKPDDSSVVTNIYDVV